MTTSTIAPSTIKTDSIVARLIERHGAAEEQRIRSGVDRVALRWTAEDGNQEAFEAFCTRWFVAGEQDRIRLLDRFETFLGSVGGHLGEIRRDLRRWSDERRRAAGSRVSARFSRKGRSTTIAVMSSR